ncbi:MAG: serine hydrolase domain-containing protein [Thermoanaerobaculia bacterium]|nr:serine hydrolase domain-containing protein [Thermoanaerobaculia bacterium]
MTRSFRAFVFLFLAIVLPAQPLAAAAPDVAAELAAALRESAGLPGLSVAVGVGDRVVWSAGFGVANLETPSAVTAETRFRCASVSKVVTVAALVRLANRGVVDLDAPIQTYLPDYPATSKPLTLRQLAGHLGGVRHYLPKDFQLPPKHYARLAEALPIFVGDPAVAPPGERYNYSTFGYTVIGAALEAATGKSFLTLLDEEVFRPLGLRHSGGDLRPDILPGRAAIYDRSRETGRVQLAAVDELSYKWPGGGLLSTPEDLVRFGFAHLGGDYLPAAVRAGLFVTQKTAAGEDTGVGLGWRVGKDWRGRRIYHHSGAQAGARSTLVLYPDDGVVVAIMTNLGNSLPAVESSAQLLAEPFLAEAKEARGPVGVTSYRGTFGGKSVAGVLVLEATTSGQRGVLSVPEQVASTLRSQGLAVGATWPLVTAFGDGPGLAFAVATPFGLLPLRLERGADGYRGTLALGGETLEFVLKES